jgi:hypothetical protein
LGILAFIIRRISCRQARLPRRVSAGLAATFIFCLPVAGHAETLSSETSLKAAFIFNFTKFVEWPESAFRGKAEFCIASLGRSPLDRELAALSGKNVHGRSIVFRQLNSPEEAAKCQVLFIGRSELARLAGILDSLRDVPVLTVSDSDDFCAKGGMFSLVTERGKIAFDANVQEIQHAGLRPSSHLLRLARKVYGRP